MSPKITFVGQAKAVMGFSCPLDRDPSPAEEDVLDAQDAALKLILGVDSTVPGVAYVHSARNRFRVWFDVRQNEICCFAILIRDRSSGESFSDPLKRLQQR